MGVGSGSYNGCGWVAAYNAFLMLGRKVHPSLIIAFLEYTGMIYAGVLGISPDALGNLFRLYRYKVTSKWFPKKKVDLEIKKGTTAILCYMYMWGAHNIAIQWDSKHNYFKAYNVFSRRSSVYI